MNLEQILEAEIWSQEKSTLSHVSLIIIHPKTWQQLVMELIKDDSLKVNKFNLNKLKYRGIKVLRSLDIEENEFLVK